MLSGIIFVFALVGCYAHAPGHGVYCGETPDRIYKCLNQPKLIDNVEIAKKCLKISECDRWTCIFTEYGWLDNNNVNKTKVSAYFDTFAEKKPAWLAAVTNLQAACLGEQDVPVQGVYINCPAYDVMHCVITSFIRNATPGQWQSTADCQYPREYAAACPICPGSCFTSQVPNGTCNACLELPRSA